MKTSITLPGSKLYENQIEIESFTVEDVARLMIIYENSSNSNVELLKLIDSKLSCSVNDIYENDFSYIMWWLRFNTFVDISKNVGYTCPHCNKQLALKLSPELVLNNVVPLKEEYQKEGIEVPLSANRKVKIKLLTLGDIKAVDNFMSEVLSSDDQAIRQMLLSIQGIEPELDLYTKYKKYLSDSSKNKLTASEFYLINQFYQDYKFGVSDVIDFKCVNPECDKSLRLPLEVSLLDFFPSIYNN